MKVGLYSGALAYDQPSMTAHQVPPEGFSYLKRNDPAAEILLATGEEARWAAELLRETVGDARPKVLWFQESRWIVEGRGFPTGFDLMISNDDMFLDYGQVDCPTVYLTLFGTWLLEPLDLEKRYMLSMIASGKNHPAAEGYRVRREAAALLGRGWEHGYGALFNRFVEDKTDAMAPYRFSVAVESESFPWWHTEKLFDCFAARAVPLYWGCQDMTKLREWGYDPAGILPWTTPEELAQLVEGLSEARYEAMLPAIETNYNRTRELYCTEVALQKVLTEALCPA